MMPKRITTIAILAIALFLIVIVTPALGENTMNTSVIIVGGNPDGTPVIKCKWEQIPAVFNTSEFETNYPGAYVLENSVDDHLGNTSTGESIFSPSANGQKEIDIWSVIYDEEDKGYENISVYAVIDNPNADQITIFLYEVSDEDITYSSFIAAESGQIVKYNTNYDFNEVESELEYQLQTPNATGFRGTLTLNSTDPNGDYKVKIYTKYEDFSSIKYLENQFNYQSVAMCDFDFTELDYGTIALNGTPSWTEYTTIGGDNTFLIDDGKPTVRNTGNVPLSFKIWQDNMTLESSNLKYKSRLSTNAELEFAADAPDYEDLDGILTVSSDELFDFSIKMRNNIFDLGTYNGKMKLGFSAT